MELNYQEIVNALQYQFNALIKEKEQYNNLVVYVANEQSFEARKLKSNEMLVAVRFGAASVFQGKIDLAVYFDIVSLGNEIDKTQRFFSDFAIMYNARNNDGVLQYWNTPSVTNRFTDYAYETRAGLSMQGALVITLTEGIVDIQVLNEDTQEYESIKFLSEDLNVEFTPLPEPTGESNGENITTNQVKTTTFSFSTYFENNYLVNNVIKVAFDKNVSFNKRFTLKIIFENAIEVEKDFVVVNLSLKRELAASSVLSIVLAV